MLRIFCLHSHGTCRPPFLKLIHRNLPGVGFLNVPLSVSCGVLLATIHKCMLEQREEHSLRKVYTVKVCSMNMILKIMHVSLFGCLVALTRLKYNSIPLIQKIIFVLVALINLFQTLPIVAINCLICIDTYLQLSFSFTQSEWKRGLSETLFSRDFYKFLFPLLVLCFLSVSYFSLC